MKKAKDLTLFCLFPQSADLTPTPRLCVATVSWADQGGKPGFLQGGKQQGLSFSGVTLAETECSRHLCTARVPPQVFWKIGAHAFYCMVCPDVPCKCKLSFLARCLPAAPRIFVYLS